MLALKLLLMVAGALMMAAALAIPAYKLWMRVMKQTKITGEGTPDDSDEHQPMPLRIPVILAIGGCIPVLLATGIVVVPAGTGGVRISQLSGTQPGTLYPGTHYVTPLIDSVELFDLRDHMFSSGLTDATKKGANTGMLTVQSKEGLNIGMGVTVRYRLDPNKLSSVQAHLPQPADKELVPPVVSSAWRELSPQYTVKEIFSTKREEVRSRAAAMIQKKLATDGIVVDEVMLSEVQLPDEYAKGLEGLLLKEQQDDQMNVDTEIQQKQVRIAELQAEAEAAQKVKRAEGDAKAKVVEAHGESDAMQFTLPLKQKQIEQSKLEAEARKEATIQNAEADAQAKVIDSKAELERRNLLAQAEASRIKIVADANADRMKGEADLLNKSPLLINKIVAERLSDKIQLVMVPSDGKFFFATDVFKNVATNPILKKELDSDDDLPRPTGH